MKIVCLGMMSALSVGIPLSLGSNKAFPQGPASVVVPERTTSIPAAVRPRKVSYPNLPSGIADAEIEILDGRRIRLSRQKRMVFLVDLWATWCTPCRAQMPRYQQLWDQYHHRGFEIIALDVGGAGGARESSDNIKRFARQIGIKYLLGHSSPELTSEFYRLSRRSSIPQAIVVGRDGRLRGVFVSGGAEHDKRLQETLTTALNE